MASDSAGFWFEVGVHSTETELEEERSFKRNALCCDVSAGRRKIPLWSASLWPAALHPPPAMMLPAFPWWCYCASFYGTI